MRAAILRGGDFAIAQLPDPKPQRDQVLVAPLFNGICGSDLHFRASLRQAASTVPPEQRRNLPVYVPGHEFSAEVVEIGPGTDTPLRVGDRIVPIPFAMTARGPKTVGVS